jgi:hypothetical protein
MKLFLLSPFASNMVDGTSNDGIYSGLPLVGSLADADAVVVPISYTETPEVNPLLRANQKPAIVFDFLEYFGQWDAKTHLFDRHPLPPIYSGSPGWSALSDHFREHPPAAYFKRELFSDCSSEARVYPVEWPCMLDGWSREEKPNFDGRAFEVFNNWGFSNPIRPRFHGQVFGLMADSGVDVVSHWDHIDAKFTDPHPRKWISMLTPHTHRRHINEVLRWQSVSKCSVTLPGSGVKCFRSTESPVNSIPVLVDDDSVWSIPWEHGVNCIRIPSSGNMAAWLSDYVAGNPDALFHIYIAAQDTVDRYRKQRYLNEYLIPTISNNL